MQEDLLHFVWKYQKLPQGAIEGSKGEKIQIQSPGTHNHIAGPDFFNAKIEIDRQLWAGTVEVHTKASDWYAHGHETDPNYNNVILHLVWEDDVQVFRKDNSIIPTLELKNLISQSVLNSYQQLLHTSKNKFINCEQDFASVDEVILNNWLERLYIERLEKKSALIFDLLKKSKNDWEKVLFCLLMKNFGLNIKGDAFLSIAIKYDFAIIRKVSNDVLRLESLLFGSAQLLNSDCTDGYYLNLKREFAFLSNKFQLANENGVSPDFFGLRPNNFPTIRLSQIANLYYKNPTIFNRVIKAKSVVELQTIFETSASSYWDNHYTFGKESKKRKKKLTKEFINLLIINTIIPIKFCYANYKGVENSGELIQLISTIKPEKNSIVTKFDRIGLKTSSALESQSKIQLYKQYCFKNRCLQCAVGVSLLNRNI